MSEASRLSARLERAVLNAALDDPSFARDLARGEVPRGVYVAFLEQRLLVHHVLEDLIRRQRNACRPLAAIVRPHHFRVGDLMADLHALDRDREAIVSQPATERLIDELRRTGFQNPANLVSYLYALERKTPRSGEIGKGALSACRLSGPNGARYMGAGGEAGENCLSQLEGELDALVLTPDQASVLIASAGQAGKGLRHVDHQIYSGV